MHCPPIKKHSHFEISKTCNNGMSNNISNNNKNNNGRNWENQRGDNGIFHFDNNGNDHDYDDNVKGNYQQQLK